MNPRSPPVIGLVAALAGGGGSVAFADFGPGDLALPLMDEIPAP